MQNAIQFITHKTDEEFIKIPKEFVNAISGEFQVILILQQTPEQKKASKYEFNAFKINTIRRYAS
ncbi:MAG: hypothetical protein Q8Q60_04420 [Candidatus Chromulinivorax sp.]|nr:hypothetical protein [Candidatus Chromulinivorax sp.]